MLDGFTVSSNCWFWSQLKLGSETDQMPNSTKVEMISFAKEMAGDPKRVCECCREWFGPGIMQSDFYQYSSPEGGWFRSLLSYRVSQTLRWRTLSSVGGLFRTGTGRTSPWHLLPHQDVPVTPRANFTSQFCFYVTGCVELQTLVQRSQNK